jgi:ABC-type transport system substrate-binding protein
MTKINFPNLSQWKRFFKILHKKEKITLVVLLILAVGSLSFLLTYFYYANTKVVAASGGLYKEGVVGQPRFINPVYGQTNDIDRDLIELTFSGLMKYDNEGRLTADLADGYTVSADGKIYDFKLKNNIFWQDGQPITAEDISFTIQTIQNPDYKSPMRANWLDVSTEIVSEKEIRLKLKSPYSSFLESCALKIIPKHIWSNILPENFALSFYNLQPVGSGPYQFENLKQTDAGFIKSLTLKANTKYYGKLPFISEITFNFFNKESELITAAESRDINGFSSAYLTDSPDKVRDFLPYSFAAPRYFAVFLSSHQTDILADQNVRQALDYATDKNDLIKKINSSFSGNYNVKIAKAVDSPVLPDFYGYKQPGAPYVYDVEKAKTLLDKAGFKDNGSGQREKIINKKPAFQFKKDLSAGSGGTDVVELQRCLAKDPNIFQAESTGYFGNATKQAVIAFQDKYSLSVNTPGAVDKITRDKLNELCIPPAQNTETLELTITTINQPSLIKVANILKEQWAKAGIPISIKTLDIQDLKPVIQGRDYDGLLYGESLGMLIDPYPFWHSSQKIDPGLNLTDFSDKTADGILKDGREALDEGIKEQKYESLQDILIKNAPAIFLYDPDYVYLISNNVQGIETKKIVDPSQRFSDVENWYLQTKRVWK